MPKKHSFEHYLPPCHQKPGSFLFPTYGIGVSLFMEKAHVLRDLPHDLLSVLFPVSLQRTVVVPSPSHAKPLAYTEV